MRTARHIGLTAKQALFGLRILGHIEELLNVGGDGLAAARAGDLCLRHGLISDFRFWIDD
jgi:hypothetical protein